MIRADLKDARALAVPAGDVELLRRAAPLHDIGKIGVSDSILLKPGRLDRHGYALMKTHTSIGHQILSGSGSRALSLSAQIALTHHEHGVAR
jgi:putative two-component system response regulator